ncbi:MAG: protein-L-isoaspartate(D-aspartate) O-methyltransferase [Dehalococcoidia bacterium]|nr:protein-L-isoaspartate(D-aspartate) O-methyltransferase [Dehalococcoidia bacterium]MDP6783609.1 protein-L-isoaspartate(D-aspartate) O-methyltransferase [Dehalococcoidia bacterium]
MDFAQARSRLMALLQAALGEGGVLQAMSQVPRELFVPSAVRYMAYDDRPLPIGIGQTISQPYIVGLMTSSLGLKGDEKVLEVGTGTGYQAAVLSLLCRRVVSVERLEALALDAEKRLTELGYANVEVHVAGKDLGWLPQAPYDGILVAAAAPHLPRELVRQLAPGGRMVVPVGSWDEQELLQVTKKEAGTVAVETLGACRFVPLVGDGAWKEEDGL